MLPSESNGYKPGKMPYYDEDGALHLGDGGYDDDDYDDYDDFDDCDYDDDYDDWGEGLDDYDDDDLDFGSDVAIEDAEWE